MSVPTYNATACPVWRWRPNWASNVNFRTSWATNVKEALSTKEERHGLVPRALFGMSFATVGLSQLESARIRRFMDEAEAMPVVMPVWVEGHKLTAQAASGTATLTIAEDVETGLLAILNSFVMLQDPDDPESYEVIDVSSAAADTVNLGSNLASTWPVGTLVWPILVGYLERGEATDETDELTTWGIRFSETWNGITDQGSLETVDVPDSLAGWDHIFENFEGYTPGDFFDTGTLSRGIGWEAAAEGSFNAMAQYSASDDLSDYSDTDSLNGLNGGEGWGGAWTVG